MAGDKIRERIQNMIDKVVSKLEEGVVPWRNKAADESGAHVLVCNPANAISLHPYTGKNYFFTRIAVGLNGWSSGWFATYLQWKANDCTVKSGEKSTLIMKWYSNQVGVDPTTNQPIIEEGFRWFHVFNIDQVQANGPTGTSFLGVNRNIVKNEVAWLRTHDNDGEDYYRVNMFDNLPDILQFKFVETIQNQGDELKYDRQTDTVIMPSMRNFSSAEAYYLTLFQGAVLAIGERMGRYRDRENNSSLTAREFLVAEFASLYLMDRFGMQNAETNGYVKYLPIWANYLKASEKNLMDVITDATRSVKYILEKMEVISTKEEEEKAEQSDD